MDKAVKRGILAACILVVVGLFASWATAIDRSTVYAPQVVGISAMTDGYGNTQLYRIWNDGVAEHSRKINGTNDYTLWEVIAE